MVKKVKSIEEKYQSLTEVEHILRRSGMWIGSIKPEQKQLFIYNNDTAKITLTDITYIPAVLKLIDEIISNSVDEYRRPENMGLTSIDVNIDKNGFITVRDNGGIPIVIHKEAGVYVPEFLFGQLRTSSNYDDSDDRILVGTNGVGSSLVNCWSSSFYVKSADGKNQYSRSWSNNMNLNDDLEITKVKKDVHFTEIKFKLDFDRLNETPDSCFTEDFISVIEKRCIDAAAANIGLNVNFSYTDNGEDVYKSEWSFKTFEEYIELFSDYVDMDEMMKFSDDIMQVWLFPDNGINVGFVNGAECSRGTHIRAVRNEINNYLVSHLANKEKIEVSVKGIDNKYSVFGIYQISNPTYDSQTKECLTVTSDRFSNNPKYKFAVPDKFLKDVSKSEIVEIIKTWYQQKLEVEDQKTLRKLNKQAKTKIKNNDKFIDANSKKSAERELWLFEGDSARSGFRAARNPQTQAAYMLRGCVKNTYNAKPSDIMANKELSDIVSIIGLQFGEPVDVKKLNFGKIVIATDADFDGHHICGLLLNFFNRWPELFENKLICRSITPIIYASKGNDMQRFYSMTEFKAKEKSLKGYKVLYTKGLGGMSKESYKEMLCEPIFHFYTKDDLSDSNIRLWFNKSIASERKNTLKNEV